ncbi:MAG: nucleoside-diphosphate kinase [Candidatus Eisenbacteria bacterium]|nr:nucleoside-diphosphate kinase [Candidatus Eisenbacteria bacterium]MCC7144381.1 nucleoside-diphosphate kinase [Candidatus Eisenbacteria bacterium]
MNVEQTFMMIKPDAVRRNLIGEVVRRIEEAGLRIARLRMVQLQMSEAQEFYAVHKERPFFGSLCEFMTSGPIVALVVEGENAQVRVREVMGATDPAKAAEGTIRKAVGLNIEQNSVHGSDALETARQEIAFFNLKLDLRG